MNVYEFAKRDAYKLQLLTAAKAGVHVYENTINKIGNCPYARELNNKFTIKDVFVRYWPKFLDSHAHLNIKSSIIDNVNRMIACKDFSYGYIFYECPNCNHYHISGLSCHSRFCSSCGKIYRERRANEIAKKCLNVPHRQFVFSIAKELRSYFRLYRDLYHELFKAVDDVFVYLIQGKSKIAKLEERELGYISFLHTFGRDLKFNPHIHVLIAERVIDQDLKFKKFEYFNFEALRKAFMNQILKRMYNYLKVHASKIDLVRFSKLRNTLYKQLKDGFYTYGPKLESNSKVSIKNITRYIARYAGHPAMSESRILNIDYDKHTITYYYDPHEDDALEDDNKQGRQFVTESIDKFIKKLIIHILRQRFSYG